MRKTIFTLSFFCVLATVGFAQPSNDECPTAIEIDDVVDYCSQNAEFTNVRATDSNTPLPGCFANTNDQDRDVWFTFIAVANTVSISVRGNTDFNGGGSLERPEFVLYSGICTNLVEEQCSNDGFRVNAVSAIATPLQIGERYFIRVNGENNLTGTFQLCINNFNEIPPPSSDCSDAVLLCDKSTVSIPYVSGRGRDDELRGNNCADSNDDPCGITESNSVWYKWICEDPGTLNFTITPDNEQDDIDFMLFELPGGINNCNSKQPLRCMMSGEVIGANFSRWEPCTGVTGMQGTDGDFSEFCGCDPGDNNFVDEITMNAGEAYALIIMNFSGSGAGFKLEFGGTGTFQGPQADIVVDASILIDEEDNVICLNEPIEVVDSSVTNIGSITSWNWNYGVGAQPNRSSAAQGPDTISYETTGTKFISLTIGLDEGCFVTAVRQIEVIPSPSATFDIVKPECNGGTDGEITLNVTGDNPAFSYDWGDGSGFVEGRNQLTDLPKGDYEITIKDSENCVITLDIPLPEDTILLNTNLTPATDPSCFGFEDGFLTIVPERGLAPYEYDFGQGYQGNNIFEGVGIGTYRVRVRDVQGCVSEFLIPVGEPDPLVLQVNSQNESCIGDSNGAVFATVSGGVGNYTYNWSNGFNTGSVLDLSVGDYAVTVQDANGCIIEGNTTIAAPDAIVAQLLEVVNVLCFGEQNGSMLLDASGGNPPFQYSIDGLSFQTSPNLTGLASGDYRIVIRDANGCETFLDTLLTEPVPIQIEAGEDQLITLGDFADVNAIVMPTDAVGEVVWTLPDGTILAQTADASIQPPGETLLTATFINEFGCVVADQLFIRVQGPPIYVPNAFSPNEDQGNDRFTIYSNGAISTITTLRIFNRWGEMVFEANNIPPNDETLGWDGTLDGELLNPAVFAYYAEVEFINGKTEVLEGDLTLIR